jgi:hypothetical protein
MIGRTGRNAFRTHCGPSAKELSWGIGDSTGRNVWDFWGRP